MGYTRKGSNLSGPLTKFPELSKTHSVALERFHLSLINSMRAVVIGFLAINS